VRRVFWLSVGAAAGYYAARKGSEAVEQARERGLVGNVTLAAGTAAKVAGTASRTTMALGQAVGSRARTLGDGQPGDAPGPAPAPTAPPTTPTSRTREARS